MSEPAEKRDYALLRKSVRTYMVEHDVSASWIAGRIGISRQAFNQWLCGPPKKALRPSHLAALKRILSGEWKDTTQPEIGVPRPSSWPALPTSDEILQLVALGYRAKRTDLVDSLTRVAEQVYRIAPELREIEAAVLDAERELIK